MTPQELFEVVNQHGLVASLIVGFVTFVMGLIKSPPSWIPALFQYFENKKDVKQETFIKRESSLNRLLDNTIDKIPVIADSLEKIASGTQTAITDNKTDHAAQNLLLQGIDRDVKSANQKLDVLHSIINKDEKTN